MHERSLVGTGGHEAAATLDNFRRSTMSTVVTSQHVSDVAPAATLREVHIYSHSFLYYWWPVWAVGFLCALLTYLQGEPRDVGGARGVMFHPSQNVGVVFTFTVLLVILLTNVAVRGTASLAVIIAVIAAVLFLAYMEWWDYILNALGKLAIYMNLGFYLFFSTVMFLIWASAVFFFDRLNYWVFQPGQLVHHTWMGGGEQSFDTRGMSVTKERSDMFRHWILGLGSGDLHIAATGARAAEFTVPNVLFIGTKLARIERLVSLKPGEEKQAVFTAGQPG
jgi:hypothetical protein